MYALQKNIMPLESFHFRHPLTLMLAGPTQSGKTTIIQKIIGQAWGGLLFSMARHL
jgi:Ni2+-binding GTPase involved in maturation of urease and hydrogenase